MAASLVTAVVAHNNATESNKQQENHANIAFVLVPVFFLLGLLGVLICHVLKRKGYRCTTDTEQDEEHDIEDEEKCLDQGELNDTFSEGNTDTVGQIVHYIMKNEANTDALKAMVTEHSMDSDGVPVTPTSPTAPTIPTPTTPAAPVSPGAPAGAAKHTCNHLHTIGGVVGQKSICSRCNQKKWPLMQPRSGKKADPAKRRSHTGEVTVLSVGRFRVTKTDPRPVRERRSLVITEPNGSVPGSPARVEPAPQGCSSPTQPQAEGDYKK
ncbi:RELT-like protein 1 [Electrophorus electricus]|uniref:RELT like 1 n=1 Tax=Electrophorus electricus TaxID=8005 RepID=A0A4W4GWK6_ELEEL|nr:RELT-like protein 1 [Electrophorus electricus]